MAKVVAESISFRFEGSNSKIDAIKKSRGQAVSDSPQLYNGLSFNLSDGERLGISGRNGAGKTTLLRIIAGILKPTSGQIRTEGRVNSLINISLGTHDELSGYDNIILRGMFMNYPRREIEAKTEEIIHFSELENVIYQPLRTYSSGMKLRLAFAIATSLPCEILLLDEWLSAGDKSFRNKAAVRMKSFVENASIVVLASNNAKTLEENSSVIINL